MRVIDYFTAPRQEHWLAQIGGCGWEAGQFLFRLLRDGGLRVATSERTRVLMLVDGDRLVSFCTYAERDDVQPTALTPWVGFVFTFPEYRGHRYAGLLFGEVERIARAEGVSRVYISTNHTGLYEKYGCEYTGTVNDMYGEPTRVYVKRIT